MSHLHIPDGIISPWLWILGYIILGIYFLAVSVYLKKSAKYKKVAVVSVLGALMLLAMSIPIPFIIPYHLNLSALAGILVGPLYAGLAIFSVNFILAMVGHGGITIVGLNTVILTTEAATAFFLFKLLKKIFNNKIFPAVFISTFIALIVSTFLTVCVVYEGTRNLEYMTNHHRNYMCSGMESLRKDTNLNKQVGRGCPVAELETFDIKRFILLLLLTGSFGWTLESFITAFIAAYISRVKPDLLENRE